MSNAKILSRSQLWESVFGGTPIEVAPYAFWWGMVPGNFDKCVIVYGESEAHARGLAESKLEGIVGHNGFVLGEKIDVV